MLLQQAKAFAACQALWNVLPGQVCWPGSVDYGTAAKGVWSKTCVLDPECVFEPHTVVSNSCSPDFVFREITTGLYLRFIKSIRPAPKTLEARNG